ncbi:MAG: NAD(P)/FAD-dependent oxidoreductase [Gammaproteobacteria bacterium]|nr:NAD(P)/FAD-dependent oxidoreductase [Gammaproteobacteria bacterium]
MNSFKKTNNNRFDVVIIGAGAAGLMCAIEAGKRGRRVLVLDKAKKAGRKILISGGGKSNFTNLDVTPENYLSDNPHFCKSALARYSQWDFMALMEEYQLSWEEREHGQLFCEQGAGAIVDLLLNECAEVGVTLICHAEIEAIQKPQQFEVRSSVGRFVAERLVIATGGPSIPKMGATDFGVRIAKQFGLKSLPFKPALVPFTFPQEILKRYFTELSGISLPVQIGCNGHFFREQMLITHRGVSGPVVLQISSYWHKGDCIEVNLLPDLDAEVWLLEQQRQQPKKELKTVLAEVLPKRLVQRLCLHDFSSKPLCQYDGASVLNIAQLLNGWPLWPSGTEGMRTAEVASGGVVCDELSSKTLEAKKVAGLFFVGETVDVTGHLGGFNFQWAWASGWSAGQVA